MRDEVIRIQNLKIYFFIDQGIVKAVDGIDFSINEGEILGLVGESGCGKTVTALSIMRQVPKPGRVVGGNIFFQGRDLLKLHEREIRRIRGNRISMIFQDPLTSLNPVYRVGEQIAEAIKIHQGLGKKAALEKAVEMLRLVEIPSPKSRATDYPHQMSGGMRQRAMIAMALSCNPRMLIADEPTTALDVTIQAQILDLINQLKEKIGTSILLITHDLGIIAEIAQYVGVMYAGVIVEFTDVIHIFKEPKHPYTSGLLHSIPLKRDKIALQNRRLRTIPGLVPSLLYLPPGCKFHERCSFAFKKCYEEEPKLIEAEPGHWVRCWRSA